VKIVLMRHGKPNFDLPSHRRKKVAPADLNQIKQRYDQSLINPNHPASHEAIITARRCNAVLCSDLPRSLTSAKALGLSAIADFNTLFREPDLPHGDRRWPHLSIYNWLIYYRFLWFFGYRHNGESIKLFKRRTRKASELLIQTARDHGSVILVGHGWINHYIARNLLAAGWQGPKSPGRQYWQFGVYTMPQTHQQPP